MAETVSTVGWGERDDEFCKNVVGRLNSLYESGDGNRKHIIGGGDIAEIELVYVDSDECRFKVTLHEGKKSMQFEGDRGIIDEQEEFAVIALKEATLNEPKTIDVSSVDSNSNSYTWSIVSPATFKDEMEGMKIAEYDKAAINRLRQSGGATKLQTHPKPRQTRTFWESLSEQEASLEGGGAPPSPPSPQPLPPSLQQVAKTVSKNVKELLNLNTPVTQDGIYHYMVNSAPSEHLKNLLPHVINELTASDPEIIQTLQRLKKELKPSALWLLLIFSEQREDKQLDKAIALAVNAPTTLANASDTIEKLERRLKNANAQLTTAQESVTQAAGERNRALSNTGEANVEAAAAEDAKTQAEARAEAAEAAAAEAVPSAGVAETQPSAFAQGFRDFINYVREPSKAAEAAPSAAAAIKAANAANSVDAAADAADE